MASNSKNLRYCEVLHSGTYYDVMIAVDDLDEVDNILQDWALDTLGETLDLPEALTKSKDATEIITSLNVGNFVYLQSAASSYLDISKYAGITGTFPVLPTTLASSLYVVPTANALLYSESDFGGFMGEYAIAAKSFAIASGVNFLGVRYNAGAPEYIMYTDDTTFDYSSIVPVASVLYFSDTIYNMPYGTNADGLAEKILESIKKRHEFDITTNFTLTTSSNYVSLGALTVNRGTSYFDCLAVDTSAVSNDMYLFSKNISGVWGSGSVTQINNTQYQSASGLASLSAGEFVVNYVYRVSSETDKLLFTVLSDKFTTVAAAKESEVITDIPDQIKESCVLVGRIIVEQGSTTPVIQKVQKYSFGVV